MSFEISLYCPYGFGKKIEKRIKISKVNYNFKISSSK